MFKFHCGHEGTSHSSCSCNWEYLTFFPVVLSEAGGKYGASKDEVSRARQSKPLENQACSLMSLNPVEEQPSLFLGLMKSSALIMVLASVLSAGSEGNRSR